MGFLGGDKEAADGKNLLIFTFFEALLNSDFPSVKQNEIFNAHQTMT